MSSPVIIPAATKHTATIIFLHGLGDTGQGWASAIGALKPPYAKVICPTAPVMPVTLNAGYRMTSWFDLKTLEINGPEDEPGIKSASTLVAQMIDNEVKSGVDPSRILLGGFSQGGALALYTALTSPRLAGVVALSCWLPLHKEFPDALKTSSSLPILMCHGDSDQIVPFRMGQLSASYLKMVLPNVDFRTYRGLAHSSSDEELRDVKKFVEDNLPPV